ncbi:hypothetical protein D9619_004552 [Psilocybe cf. subviscida]|uniref:Uncharacterized protein n=1 Tax=Psilocybe cf. subviscida TaxID=2480587 RepID=A0A8H5BR15_9AGAR|nr:hypothetical protein D9619_004552 [Psilocybe cf. subviscida]
MATWALIENTNSAISYGGPWSEASGLGLSGNSVHVLLPNIVNSTTPPATLTFNFTGREIGVYGVASIFNNSVTVPEPVWECAVDGNLLANSNPYGTYPLMSYCEATDLEGDISHTFELSVSQSGTGFFVDFLKYLVGPGHFATVPPNTTAWIAADDPRLGGQGWTPLGDGFRTIQAGPPTTEMPVLSFAFAGSSVTYYGFSKAAMGLADPTLPALTLNGSTHSEGFYTIDDASNSHAFSASITQDVALANSNPYNVALFTTPLMEIGVHTVNVYYDVNSTVWPLTLDSLTITDGFSILPIFVPSQSPTHKNRAVVIGGAIGGVLGGLVLILLVLFIRRRWMMKRREERRKNMITGIERNDIKLRPFSRLEDVHDTNDQAGHVDALQEH